MQENIISWNVPNFVTVGIIGVLMFTAFGFAAQLLKRRGIAVPTSLAEATGNLP